MSWANNNNNDTTTLLILQNDGVANISRKFSILSVGNNWHLLAKIAKRNFEYKEVQQN